MRTKSSRLSRDLYQPSEELTDDGPVAGGDRGDAAGFGEKFSPGVLAGVKDVGVGGEHTVGEIGLSQILPDVLGCVELRTGGGQRHEGGIGRGGLVGGRGATRPW